MKRLKRRSDGKKNPIEWRRRIEGAYILRGVKGGLGRNWVWVWGREIILGCCFNGIRFSSLR